MGRRRKRKDRGECGPVAAIAFGAGLLLAMFCSVRFALVIAAITLIYIGICYKH